MIQISIIIPVYNGAKTLDACLNSIFENHGVDFEVIVVDDGSTDETSKILHKYPCRIVTLPENRGRGFARNRGIEEARSPYLLFTDADCIVASDWAQTALAQFSKIMEMDPSIAAAEGRILPMKGFFNKCDAYAAYGYNQDLKPHYTNHFCTANIIVDKKKLMQAGLFNERMPNLEDRDLGFRLLDCGYRLYYQPAFSVVHNPPRQGWWGFLRHEYEWGRTVGNYFDMRYPHHQASPFRSWMGSPALYAMVAPVFAALIPLKIILHNLNHDWSVIFLYPLLFLSKASYRNGALEFMRKKQWTEFA